jgi:hypothetical protein
VARIIFSLAKAAVKAAKADVDLAA